jgi:hypothetical protein
MGWQTEEQARKRLAREQRDVSAAGQNDLVRPSAPGFLQTIWGKAAAQVSTLIDAFERRPIEAGMVDTSSNVPTVKIPALTGAAATAVQASENASVQETDATSTARTAPVAMIAGQEDLSRQAVDFSEPGLDEVITDSLARGFGVKLDVQVLNGGASAGATRGLLNTESILNVTGSVTTAEAFAESLWKAYSQLAGGSGFGNPRPEDYVTLLHPRRLAWVSGGSGSTTLPQRPNLPSTIVPVGSVPTNLGAGTNEDVAPRHVGRGGVRLEFGAFEAPMFDAYLPKPGGARLAADAAAWART